MSNGDTYVDVRSEGKRHLEMALDLCLIYHSGGRFGSISHALEHENGLYFGWNEGCGGEPLVADTESDGIGRDALVEIIFDWLRTKAVYPRESDIDGSIHKGWRVISHYRLMPKNLGGWKSNYLTFGVLPEWMEYHK